MTATMFPELPTVAGELYGALLEARPYVERIADANPVQINASSRDAAARRLERIDAALADAGEWIERSR